MIINTINESNKKEKIILVSKKWSK
jgi:hypothetical protein